MWVSTLKGTGSVAIAPIKTTITKCLSASWLKSSVPGRVRGRRGTGKSNSIDLFARRSLPLGQQLQHTVSIQQMFDDELYKNMIHVECVKVKIVVLGFGGIKYHYFLIFSI